MANIKSLSDLKNEIAFLELHRIEQEQIIKEQFIGALDDFKSTGAFKSISGLIGMPGLLTGIIPTALSIGAGLITDFIVARTSGKSKLKRRLISGALLLITRAVVKRSELSKLFTQKLMQNLFA